ncbi:MAG: hypothetical protein HYS98_03055 [Deltaproteobacteria bacterium]|nr:hypothetical protein [Deltaproteobacteria bacterium]
MNTRKIWDNFVKNAKKVGDKTWGFSKIAGTRAVEFEKMSPLLAKKFNINRNMHKHYEQLGQMTYEVSKLREGTQVPQNPEVKELLHELSALENELEGIENQIDKLKMQYDKKVIDLKSDQNNKKYFG